MQKTIFLTGATGFIGRNLIEKILVCEKDVHLFLLIRGKSNSEVQHRVDKIIQSFSINEPDQSIKKCITVVKGDVSKIRFGLSNSDYDKLASKVTHIIHSAASTKFTLPLQEARKVNLIGTKNLMDFAKHAKQSGNLQRVAHISTAYVSGKRTGTIRENELDCGQLFGNTYEQTKFETELYVRNLMRDLPITVFRPSIVVGNSKSGKTTAFNVLYYPLKLIYQKKIRLLPGWDTIPMDVVPIDYVCNALYHIFLKTNKGIGETYHLTAGGKNSITTGKLAKDSLKYFETNNAGNFKPVRFIHPVIVHFILNLFFFCSHRIKNVLKIYEPYLTVKRTFDNSNTQVILQNIQAGPPSLEMYLPKILQYCLVTNWGENIDYAV